MLPVYRTSPILRQPSSKVWCTNWLWGGPWLTCIVFQLGQNLRLGCSGQGQPQGPLAQGCGSQRQQHRPQRSRDSVQLEHWPGLMSEEVFQGQVTDPGPSTVAGNLLFVSYCTGTSWNETVVSHREMWFSSSDPLCSLTHKPQFPREAYSRNQE